MQQQQLNDNRKKVKKKKRNKRHRQCTEIELANENILQIITRAFISYTRSKN